MQQYGVRDVERLLRLPRSTIRALMDAGFVTPTAGRVSVCGFDVETQAIEARSRIGYLPEGAPVYPEMTPLSFLDFIADVRGLTGVHALEPQRHREGAAEVLVGIEQERGHVSDSPSEKDEAQLHRGGGGVPLATPLRFGPIPLPVPCRRQERPGSLPGAPGDGAGVRT